MANVTKKTDVKYVLELSEREANALCELLVVAHYDGEGDKLNAIYAALVEAGAESDEVEHRMEDGLILVKRSAA